MKAALKLFVAVLFFSSGIVLTTFASDDGSVPAGPEIQLYYLYQGLNSGSGVDLGDVPLNFQQPSAVFTLSNLGDADLTISEVTFLGTDASNFSTDLATGAVLAGGEIRFQIFLTKDLAGTVTAQLKIVSDDVDESEYLVDLTANMVESDLVVDMYGPQIPPPRDLVFSEDGAGVGRPGGLNYRFANVNLAAVTPLYWGTFTDESGKVEVKLSMDDLTYEGEEFMEYDPVGSDLSNGLLIWLGKTEIIDYQTATHTVYTRFVLTATQTANNDPVTLVDPARLGMDNRTGGFLPITDISDQLTVNMRFEASLTFGTGYEPYLEFYDNYSTPPGAIGTASSYWPGYFWNNVAPRIAVNASLDIDEGDAPVITNAYLSVVDDEDGPEAIMFEFVEGTGEGSNPVKYGDLKKAGVALTMNDNFSMQDILDGSLVYEHNGEEWTEDNFVFKASDSRGLYVMDGPYDAFTFRINITIIDDPPIAADGSYEIVCGGMVSGQVSATDEEGGTITFEVVTPPDFGVLTLDENTGDFTWTDIYQAGNTLFQYRAYDGNSYSENATVNLTVSYADQTVDFTDPGTVLLSDNSLALIATASSGLDVSFSTTTTDVLTIEGTTATLLQTGEANVTASQAGDACYNEAEPVFVTFCVRPDASVITVSGLGGDSPVLTSDAASGNQWYNNGTPINGATSNTYNVQDEGSYTATVTENGCESPNSNAIVIVITGAFPKNSNGVRVYPNPVLDHLVIETLKEGIVFKYTLTDLNGRKIYEGECAGTFELDLSGIRAGVYQLMISGDNELFSSKIVKH